MGLYDLHGVSERGKSREFESGRDLEFGLLYEFGDGSFLDFVSLDVRGGYIFFYNAMLFLSPEDAHDGADHDCCFPLPSHYFAFANADAIRKLAPLIHTLP